MVSEAQCSPPISLIFVFDVRLLACGLLSQQGDVEYWTSAPISGGGKDTKKSALGCIAAACCLLVAIVFTKPLLPLDLGSPGPSRMAWVWD